MSTSPERPRALRHPRGATAVAVVLAGILAAAALLFGAVHAWAAASVEAAIFLLAAAAFAAGFRSDAPPGVRAAAAGLLLWLAASLVPLPPVLLGTLSPATAERHRLVAEVLAAAGGGGEIRPVGGVEDERIPPGERERLRELAAEARRTRWPAEWKPAALHPFAARARLLQLLAAAAVFWLAASVPAPRRLLAGLVVAAALLSAVGLVQFFAGNGRLLWVFEPYDRGVSRIDSRLSGPFVNPDHFGAFAALTLPPALALWLLARREGRRGEGFAAALRREVPAAAVFLLAAVLAGAGSRAAAVAAAAASATFSWWVWRRPHARARPPRNLLDGVFRAIERAATPGSCSSPWPAGSPWPERAPASGSPRDCRAPSRVPRSNSAWRSGGRPCP